MKFGKHADAQVKKRFENASKLIREYSKGGQKVLPRSWSLTKGKLGLKSQKYCHYSGKAWHVSVIMSFLCKFMENKEVDDDLKMIVWSGDALMRLLYTEREENGPLLSEQARDTVKVLGVYHCRLLLVLHAQYWNFCAYYCFNVRPKYHMLSHIIDMAVDTGRNPVTQACWMEEDWVRQVAAVARKTHMRTSQLSTLRRYSAGVGVQTCNSACWLAVQTLPQV